MTPDPRDGDPLRPPDPDPLPVVEGCGASYHRGPNWPTAFCYLPSGHGSIHEWQSLPVVARQGCRWWLLWLAVGAAFWAIVIALILANRAAPAAPSEGPDASVTVKGYTDVPVLRGAPLASPSLPAVAARPQPSRARESAPVTTPSPDTAVVHRGVASHMGDSPDAGPRYLALPIGPGHRVRLCGAIRCLTLTSTDAGPALFMQRRGRIADLSVELFEMLTGRPASRGLAPVSWKGME